MADSKPLSLLQVDGHNYLGMVSIRDTVRPQ